MGCNKERKKRGRGRGIKIVIYNKDCDHFKNTKLREIEEDKEEL